MGGVALFQRNHPVVMLDRAAIQFDFARIVMDCRVVRFDLIDCVILRERIGTGDRQQGCGEHQGGFHEWFS
jgi:hypothetical protein